MVSYLELFKMKSLIYSSKSLTHDEVLLRDSILIAVFGTCHIFAYTLKYDVLLLMSLLGIYIALFDITCTYYYMQKENAPVVDEVESDHEDDVEDDVEDDREDDDMPGLVSLMPLIPLSPKEETPNEKVLRQLQEVVEETNNRNIARRINSINSQSIDYSDMPPLVEIDNSTQTSSQLKVSEYTSINDLD